MIPSFLTKKLKQHPVMQAVCQVSQQVEIPIYLVGGAVRDLLMGMLPKKDFDFVMEDNLIKVARLFSHIVSGSLIEWSSDPLYYRVVFYLNDNRIEVDFSDFQGDDLTQDLHNRDFTINAMALMVNELLQDDSPKLYDPLKGKEDLQKRILRVTSEHSFAHDPLRILRAVRIAKARNLTLDSKTREEIDRQKERLLLAAAERIRSEFFKTLSFSGAEDSLNLLEDLNLLSILFPETQPLKSQKREEHWGRSLWEDALQRVRWCEWVVDNPRAIFPQFHENLKSHFIEEIEADVDRRSLLKLGGLLLDCEKSHRITKDANVTKAIVKRFKLGKRAARILKKLSDYHNRVLNTSLMEEINPRVYFRFFRDVGPEGLDILVLSWADFIATGPERFENTLDAKLRKLLTSLVKYYFNEYIVTFPRPLITGKDIIEQFGLEEGKDIGFLLEKVAEAEGEGLLSSTKEAILYVEALLGQRQRSI